MADENIDINIKVQLKEANAELIQARDRFGDLSKEAINAARKVGELKEKIGDARAQADAFTDGGKFKAVTNSLAGIAGGFSAVQGAISLVSNDTKALAETTKKLQAAMALTQGLTALSELGDAFKVIKTVGVNAFTALKGAIGATGIGLLVVASAAIVANWTKIKKVFQDTFPALKDTATLFDKIKEVAMGAATVIFKMFTGIGKAITNLVKGNFSAALDDLKTGFDVVENYQQGAEKQREVNLQNHLDEQLAKTIKNREDRIAVLQAEGKDTYNLEKKNFADKKKLAKDDAEEMAKLRQEEAILDAQHRKKLKDQADVAAAQKKKDKEQSEKEVHDLVLDLMKEVEEEEAKAAEEKKKKEEEELERQKELAKKRAEIAKDAAFEVSKIGLDSFDKQRLDVEEKYKERLATVEAGSQAEIDLIKLKNEEIGNIEKAEALARLEAKQAIVSAELDLAMQAGQLIQQLAGENKKAQIAGLIIEQAGAIGKIASNTAVANAKSVAAFPLTAGQPWVTINTVSAALSAASVIAGVAKSIKQINSAGSGSNSSGGSQSEPVGKSFKLAKGGLLWGPSHQEGGIKTGFGQEVEGGEFVVNKAATAKNLDLLKAINNQGKSVDLLLSKNPLITKRFDATETILQQLNERSPDQGPIKAYVVASEVSSQQEANKRVNDLAKL